MFQHTATRRWLGELITAHVERALVSTHSHPKVAGGEDLLPLSLTIVSTHSHPKVAGMALLNKRRAA